MRNGSLVGALGRSWVLLIAPSGVERSWAQVGSPSQARAEIDFLDALPAGISGRWPIEDRLPAGTAKGAQY